MAGSLDRRIEKLEELYASEARGPSEADRAAQAEAEARREIMTAILDEIGRLGACRARNVYRGGTPPTPIQPTDPTGEALGYPYTHGELSEFAVQRALERLRPDSEEVSEEIITAWVELMRSMSGEWWDEVAAEGPPERTPPYR